MSFPHTEEVISALVGNPNQQTIEAAVTLLRQYFILCQTMEADIETFRAAKNAAMMEKDAIEQSLQAAMVDKQKAIDEKEALRIQKEQEIMAETSKVEAAQILVAQKELEKQNALDDLKAQLNGKISELAELKLHPALVAVDEQAKALKIANLEAELASLRPKEEGEVKP